MNTYAIPIDRLAQGEKLFNSRPRKRTVNFKGLPIAIEIEKGDTYSGIGEDGKPWVNVYEYPYGEVPSTLTLADNDPVDVYIGDNPESNFVYVVHQLKRDGKFDEPKAFLGFPDMASAVLAYRKHGPSWGFGGIDTMSWDQFRFGYLKAFPRIHA